MIEVRIRKHFPARDGATGFTLAIEFETSAGVTVLFGPSGAGKTLTLDSIAGFVRPDDGLVRIDDEVLYDRAAGVMTPPRRRYCGYVFQNYALFPHMTLRQNLEFAARSTGRIERHRRITAMLEQFRLTEVEGRRPREVSGGQQQRCSIARALIGAPKLLLLDEPARGLDAPLREDLYAVLRQVRRDFLTPILLVTHDLDECFALGEQMLVIDAGKVVQSGTPREILDRPAGVDVARLLGQYNLLPAEIAALDPGNRTSLLRIGRHQVQGPYFPGRLRGDRVTLYVRPDQLRAGPPGISLGPDEIVLDLAGVAETPGGVRLSFLDGISVDMTRADFEPYRDNKRWRVRFPAEYLRLL